MSNCLSEIIKNRREVILTGEIGALLHDIGKCHPNFIKIQSLEGVKGLPHHARGIDGFIEPQLLDLFKHERLKVKLSGDDKTSYDFIRYHHNPTGPLLEYLKECDGKDSADDKGVVREKQSLKDTTISSPFGYRREKIDLDCFQKRFEDLENGLIDLFKNYISGTIDISCFRNSLVCNLKTRFSHALGETRIPANDVTLWDHSYSTASLFKSVLAAAVCGVELDPKSLKWRIFGISWDGTGFISRGRKIAEIQARSEIIEDIKRELRRKFEDEVPIGNVIYEDTNGIYFTFPDLDDKSEDLVRECVEEEKVLEIIYDHSNNELWPFFTLSRASGTLTIIAEELEFASKKRKIPRMTPTLFVEGEPREFFDNPEITSPVGGQEVCPVCRIRSKNLGEERCEVCDGRRKGRLKSWFSNREETVWIDEVADKNDRIALISLSFDLDKWLDGTMVGTIYSQSFEEWRNGERYNKRSVRNVLRSEDIKQGKYLYENAFNIAEWIANNPTKTEVKPLLECFMEDGNANNVPAEVKSDANKILSWFFTQNPSPARLHRIWRETEEFFDSIIWEIKGKIYKNKWRRIKFSVDYPGLESEFKGAGKNIEDSPLIIKVKGLKPESLLVYHTTHGEFYTIESLEKFRFKDEKEEEKTGQEAVEEALSSQGFDFLALEDDPDINLLKGGQIIRSKDLVAEEYYPLILINKSPLSLRFIVPAFDSMKIIELIAALYNERFEKVIGKLPLNIKLLVARRKFPLYILLDSEERMLEGKEFKKQIPMNPWWDVNGVMHDKYYGFYPTKQVGESEKYTLDDLTPISKGRIFSLYPGYFDFDLLSGTADRYKIRYSRERGIRRMVEDYKLFTGRPYYFYQISKILELWDVLSNLSSSQINFIEVVLTSKIREWRNIKAGSMQKVFREFAEATLIDAFGEDWSNLRDETKFFLVNSAINGLLLDTIALFRHVIKKEVDE